MMNKRFTRFALVGGLCFSSNLLTLYLGTELFGWHYLVSMCLSIVIANSLGWRLNRSWTFASREKFWWLEYSRYIGVSLSSIIFSLVLMYICVDIIGINYLLSSAAIALIMLTINYFAHGKFSFKSLQ